MPSPICLCALGKIQISGLFESCLKCLTDAFASRYHENYLCHVKLIPGADADTGRQLLHTYVSPMYKS